MSHFIKRNIYPFVVPAGILIMAAVSVWIWPDLSGRVRGVKELNALIVLLPHLPYIIFFIGLIIALRYNNLGMIVSNLVLGFSYFLLYTFWPSGIHQGVGPTIPAFFSILIPINLVYFSMLTKRRLFTSAGFFCLMFLHIQVFLVLLFHLPENPADALLFARLKQMAPLMADEVVGIAVFMKRGLNHFEWFGYDINISTPAMLAFIAGFLILLIRFFFKKTVIRAGFIGILAAMMLSFMSVERFPALTAYFAVAGMIMIITSIEASFSMAYMDELTGLPGRRSLNETLLNMGKRYTIAMIDIDHFKKFNDTYGHHVGDQVLMMLAVQLTGISGGAKVYRYGGEEFTAIFPGKDMDEAHPHLESFRKQLAGTSFILRGSDRRKLVAEKPEDHLLDSDTFKVRKQDRRTRKKYQKSHNPLVMKRHMSLKDTLRAESKGKPLQITVSIGMASANELLNKPEKVLKAADKALYKAKQRGRNRTVK